MESKLFFTNIHNICYIFTYISFFETELKMKIFRCSKTYFWNGSFSVHIERWMVMYLQRYMKCLSQWKRQKKEKLPPSFVSKSNHSNKTFGMNNIWRCSVTLFRHLWMIFLAVSIHLRLLFSEVDLIRKPDKVLSETIEKKIVYFLFIT